MKRPMNKALLGVMVVLTYVGAVRADDGTVNIQNTPPSKQAILNQLVQQGFLIPLPTANWYQINEQRLQDVMAKSEAGDTAAQTTINNLKAIVGNDVDIKQVDVFEAHVGTQDGGGE